MSYLLTVTRRSTSPVSTRRARSASPRSRGRSASPRARSASPRRSVSPRRSDLPPYFEENKNSQAIFNAVKTKYPQLLTNENVVALVKHHSAVLKAVKSVRKVRNMENCMRQLNVLRRFVKIEKRRGVPVNWTVVFDKLHNNMAGVITAAAPALALADAKAVLKLQAAFEKEAFAALKAVCA